METVIKIAHSHNLPVVVDAAGEVYPTEKLSRYVNMGADLVAYGAKYFGAVNSSGILTGRRDLVEAARSHSFIGFEATQASSFGRPMKVDRQEVIAVYAALREWLTTDHESRFASYEARISALRADLEGIPHIRLATYPEQGPPEGLAVNLDAEKLGKTAAQVSAELRAGNPSIWVRAPTGGGPDDYPPGQEYFIVRMPTLKTGGEKVIAERLKQILEAR